MFRIFEGLVHEHDHGFLAIAVVICIIGAALTVTMTRRMLRADGRLRTYLIILSGVIGGTTIWSTHFMAMLSYHPPFDHSFNLPLTGVSLALAVVGTLICNTVLASRHLRGNWVFSGLIFGLTVPFMHFTGMAAYTVPGQILWEPARVIASILFGAAIGTIAYHRIIYPVTRFCWLGAVLALILAICAMHFTAMTAFAVVVDPSINLSESLIEDTVFGVVVAGVTGVLYLAGFAALLIELSLRQESRWQLTQATRRDPLTGLPNRTGLTAQLTEIDLLMQENQLFKLAVISIDLQAFKMVNDVHGHRVGDQVLCSLAERLSDVLQPDEFIARTAGDEFIALKRGFRRMEEVAAFAERLHAVLVEPVDFFGATVTLRAAIGTSNSLDDGREIEGLVNKSNQALRRAKELPDHSICHYNDAIDRQTHERSSLVNDLRAAIENDELFLVYQLQNSLSTLDIVGFECLLRWQHPDRGLISPGEFIPIAEETGLIRDIGAWVLETACAEAASWPQPIKIAVNVAPQQLIQPSFVEHVADVLERTGLPPSRLELELTEDSFIDDQEHVMQVMQTLKDMGLRIAMDDFGTGYSSLASLQAFPFDKIKIDRSFITDVHVNKQRAAIVRATVLLGTAMDIPVLAEGVETQDELDFLRAEKCTSVQGFYFGKPLMVDDVRALLEERSRAQAS